MPSRTTAPDPPKCQVCKEHASKYRCSACPVKYCSVPCYKRHKEEDCTADCNIQAGPSSAPPRLDVSSFTDDLTEPSEDFPPSGQKQNDASFSAEQKPISLKPLSALLWPPEPDASIFTDPLRRDDPKPLRREELLRIATSPQLRHLLTSTALPHILRILDALPTPNARQSTLSRLLGLDPESLAKPTTNPLLSQRDSPPPLGELLDTLAGKREEEERGWNETGWWLGREETKERRVWIGEEEKKIMRIFAGVVCEAIDGGQGDEPGWGRGDLSWEV